MPGFPLARLWKGWRHDEHAPGGPSRGRDPGRRLPDGARDGRRVLCCRRGGHLRRLRGGRTRWWPRAATSSRCPRRSPRTSSPSSGRRQRPRSGSGRRSSARHRERLPLLRRHRRGLPEPLQRRRRLVRGRRLHRPPVHDRHPPDRQGTLPREDKVDLSYRPYASGDDVEGTRRREGPARGLGGAPVEDASLLPPPSTTQSWDGSVMPAKGEAEPRHVVRRRPRPHRRPYEAHVDPGVPALFAVPLDWGQHVEVSMQYKGAEYKDYVPIEAGAGHPARRRRGVGQDRRRADVPRREPEVPLDGRRRRLAHHHLAQPGEADAATPRRSPAPTT